MKNDRGIKLLIDEAAEACAAVSDAADTGIEADELAEIDALLRLVADESSASIDFETIKQRAVSSAKKKKQKRGKVRRAVSYALFGCAALVLGFSIYSSFNSAGNRVKDPSIVAYASESPKISPSKDPGDSRKGASGDQTPIWRMEAGAVSSDAYKDITKKVSDLFPESLPDNMMKLVDESEAQIAALGTDGKGEEICYDFIMSTEPPIHLQTGEACSVEDGEYLVYYWQVSEENCVSVRFAGFEQEQADSMFNALAKRIVQIVPNDGRR